MGQLSGKTALVTGGTSGIGLATAQCFVDEGAHVFITGRRKPELDAAVEKIGHDITGVQGDVAKLDDLDRLYTTIAHQNRRLDVLFANAGGGQFARLEDVTEEHFDATFDSNVKGLVFTVQKALPVLNDGASIILTSSITGSAGGEAFGIYGASKGTAARSGDSG
jgi:NAD(P)-dependent dehydrogenase (short-subunit alcohol dehydrogenase family)